MTRWEYRVLTVKVVMQKERTGGFFAHHLLQSDFDPDTMTALTELGDQGWEVVACMSLPMAKEGPGRDFAIMLLKRPKAPDAPPFKASELPGPRV